MSILNLRRSLTLFLLLTLNACQQMPDKPVGMGISITSTPTLTRPLTPRLTPLPTVTWQETKVVEVTVFDEQINIETEVTVGKTARVIAYLDPTIIGRGSNGGAYYRGLPSSTAETMQLCASLDRPCPLTGQWMPFTNRREFTIPVEWLGPREFWVTAQFRDATGIIIPSYSSTYDREGNAASIKIIGVLDEQTPVTVLPTQVQTAIAATRVAFPVTGSVVIAAGGHCCIGGGEGETIPIIANFKASSPFAEVTEMRTVERCTAEAEMAKFPWEPFKSTKSFPFTITGNNWFTFDVGVQYRDAKGNLSPVYCDYVVVEGMPMFTPAP